MSDNGNTGFRRWEAFYGRRKAKGLSPKQQHRMDALLPALRLDPQTTPVADLTSVFSHQPAHLVLEIGFGGGEHLLHQAKNNPGSGFVGVEPFINSMAKMLASIDDAGVENIRLYDEDATALLDWLPEACLDRVDLLYPDPWPKKRHWKRRFVSQRNLDRIARVLKPGGLFHFASDIETYVNWTLEHCERHAGFEWLATCCKDWEEPFPGWTRTRYEAKALREGRTPCYLRFRKSA